MQRRRRRSRSQSLRTSMLAEPAGRTIASVLMQRAQYSVAAMCMEVIEGDGGTAVGEKNSAAVSVDIDLAACLLF